MGRRRKGEQHLPPSERITVTISHAVASALREQAELHEQSISQIAAALLEKGLGIY
jgi:hypothetical protein